MAPIILNTPEPMIKVRVVTVKDYSEKTLKTLHEVGVLHVEESKELKPVDKAAVESERSKVRESLTHIENLLAFIPEEERVSITEDVGLAYARPFDEIHNEVELLYAKLANVYQKTLGLSGEAKGLRELKKYLAPLGMQTDARLGDLNYTGDYLFSRVFTLPKEVYETFSSQIKGYLLESVVIPVEGEVVFYAIAKVEGQKTIDSIAESLGGKVVRVPAEERTLRDFLRAVEDRIPRLEEELSGLKSELQSKTRENLEKIVLLREVLSAENERLSVLEKACEAKYVTLIEGWIPESEIEPAVSQVRESIDYVFIDTKKPDKSEAPPSKLRNFKGVKPFQVIVNLFAVPQYGGWDPTPIVAYSFAFFFGLMFADVIYALGLMLATRFLLPKLVDDPESEGFRLFKRVLYISGGVALVVGLLTGNYLGNIHEFFGLDENALVLVGGVRDWLGDPVKFLVLSLYIGLIHVNIAHAIAMYKGIKEGNKGVVLNKIGLFITQIFGVPFLVHSLLHTDLLPLSPQAYSVCLYLMFVGIVLVIVSALVQKGGLGSIFWLFDLTGLLGDVMSYARLAGVGLATYYLASAFNQVASMLSGMASGFIPGVAGVIVGVGIAVIILIIAHMFNLFLSVLTGFIHSLRLCFVEFMIKFYEGGGREYSPFQLKTPRSVIVGGKP